MLERTSEITPEEIYPKLLPTSFWEEIAILFPHIVSAKAYPFKSPSAILPFLERFNEHKKALEAFLCSLEERLPEPIKPAFCSVVQNMTQLHLENFMEQLALQCQENLRAYFQMQYTPDPTSQAKQLSDLTLNSFVVKNRIALVEFFAEWCNPCKSIIPHMNKLINRYQDKISVGKVDLDRYPELAKTHNVVSIPTLLFFKEGQPVKRLVGLHTVEDMDEIVQRLLHE